VTLVLGLGDAREGSMVGKPRPKPCYLDDVETCGAPDGRKRWRDRGRKHLYTWDHVHGHIEVFTMQGVHIGVMDAASGEFIGLPVPGRRIDV
jgi:hypothetical protein